MFWNKRVGPMQILYDFVKNFEMNSLWYGSINRKLTYFLHSIFFLNKDKLKILSNF